MSKKIIVFLMATDFPHFKDIVAISDEALVDPLAPPKFWLAKKVCGRAVRSAQGDMRIDVTREEFDAVLDVIGGFYMAVDHMIKSNYIDDDQKVGAEQHAKELMDFAESLKFRIGQQYAKN